MKRRLNEQHDSSILVHPRNKSFLSTTTTNEEKKKKTKLCSTCLTTTNTTTVTTVTEEHNFQQLTIQDVIPNILSFLSNGDLYNGPLTVNKQWFYYCTLVWYPYLIKSSSSFVRQNHNQSSQSLNCESALVYACQKGHTNLVHILLNQTRVDATIQNHLAIRFACKYGHLEIVKMLLSWRRRRTNSSSSSSSSTDGDNDNDNDDNNREISDSVDPSLLDNYCIRFAAHCGHTEIVKLLLKDERVDPSADHHYAIRFAAISGHTEIVKLLLNDSRVDCMSCAHCVLKDSVANGRTDIVQMLLSLNNNDENDENDENDKRRSIDPSVDDNMAIKIASEYGHLDVVKLLLSDPRVDPSAGNNQAIKMALAHGRTEVVQLLQSDSRVDYTHLFTE